MGKIRDKAENRKESFEELEEKEKCFPAEYLKDLNATHAAIRCGYSSNRADVAAYRLLRIPAIAQEIERLQAERAKKLEITEEKVLNELAKIAFHDIADFYKDDKTPIHPKDLDNLQSACISEFETDPDNQKKVKKIKLYDKLNALDKLCKKLGLFKEDNAQRSGFADWIAQINESKQN